MNPVEQFTLEKQQRITAFGQDQELQDFSRNWLQTTMSKGYVYNFSSLGRPIIQYPQDMVAMQELIWQVRPDLIIETGIAHGGSIVLSASMLAMLDMCDAIEAGTTFDPKASKRLVLGIDIDIRSHNRDAIEAHPMSSRIKMLQGSSVSPEIIREVRELAAGYQRVLVCLDSMHTHDHVMAELEGYAPLVTPGSYCVVFDTFVQDMPEKFFADRPWDVGNNPKTAVWEYLQTLQQQGRQAVDGAPLSFEIDRALENKLLVTVAPDGYLKRVDKSIVLPG